jgi:hypothetical protein
MGLQINATWMLSQEASAAFDWFSIWNMEEQPQIDGRETLDRLAKAVQPNRCSISNEQPH